MPNRGTRNVRRPGRLWHREMSLLPVRSGDGQLGRQRFPFEHFGSRTDSGSRASGEFEQSAFATAERGIVREGAAKPNSAAVRLRGSSEKGGLKCELRAEKWWTE